MTALEEEVENIIEEVSGSRSRSRSKNRCRNNNRNRRLQFSWRKEMLGSRFIGKACV